MDIYPPNDETPETRRWERWAEHVRWAVAHRARDRRRIGGRMTARQRRARRRWDIQQARKLRRRGICPCSDYRINDPGPHIDSCPWSNDDFDGYPT